MFAPSPVRSAICPSVVRALSACKSPPCPSISVRLVRLYISGLSPVIRLQPSLAAVLPLQSWPRTDQVEDTSENRTPVGGGARCAAPSRCAVGRPGHGIRHVHVPRAFVARDRTVSRRTLC